MDLRLRSESEREAEDHGREKRNKEEGKYDDGERGFNPK